MDMSLSNPASTDPVDLASRLIACPSVTPAKGAVFDALQAMVEPLGFVVDRFLSGDAPDGPVENMIAGRNTGEGKHFAFAGILMSYLPATGGPATRSYRRCAAICSMVAAPWI